MDKGTKRAAVTFADAESCEGGSTSKKVRSVSPSPIPNAANHDNEKTRKRLPKNKRKQQLAKQSRSKKAENHREFASDVKEYVLAWTKRDTPQSTWKFNKVLQSWALDHCFHKDKVESKLFKLLLPYLLSVKGVAADRLVSRAASILSTDKVDIIDDTNSAEIPAESGDNPITKDDEEKIEDDEMTAEATIAESKREAAITLSMVKRAKKIQKAFNA